MLDRHAWGHRYFAHAAAGFMATQDFEKLFYSTGADLRRFLSGRIACPHTVSDMMQEAFLKLMGAPPTTDIRNARAYLFRIAANLVINYGTRRREPIVPVLDEDGALSRDLSDERTPERIVDGSRRLRHVMEAIASLPPRCKEVFILYPTSPPY